MERIIAICALARHGPQRQPRRDANHSNLKSRLSRSHDLLSISSLVWVS